MKKIYQTIFIGLLIIPFVLMITSKTKEVYGTALSAHFTVVKAEKQLSSKAVKSKGANGVLICWKNIFESGQRVAGITINEASKNLVLSAQQVSAIHTCMEAHTGKIAYETKKRYGKKPNFEPLPEIIKITAFPADGKQLEIMTDEDGYLKVWLLKEEWFGERFFYHLAQIVERAGQYKPVSSFFGYILLFLWLAGTVVTAFIIIREKQTEPL